MIASIAQELHVMALIAQEKHVIPLIAQELHETEVRLKLRELRNPEMRRFIKLCNLLFIN